MKTSLIRTVTVGFGISPNQFPVGKSRTVTAGKEFHLALKFYAAKIHNFLILCYILLHFFNKMKSRVTIAAIASTIGTTRGTTHTSWRPLISIVVALP